MFSDLLSHCLSQQGASLRQISRRLGSSSRALPQGFTSFILSLFIQSVELGGLHLSLVLRLRGGGRLSGILLPEVHGQPSFKKLSSFRPPDLRYSCVRVGLQPRHHALHLAFALLRVRLELFGFFKLLGSWLNSLQHLCHGCTVQC